MKKFNKLVSTVVATAVVMNAMVVPALAVGDFVPTEDGTYVSDEVKAYQYYSPDQNSMCNGVFAGEADVTIDGDWATLHLYVCNPTPGNWGGLDTGLLSSAYITYDGNTYDGSLTTIGQVDGEVNPDAAVKLFTQDSSFFGITSGEYNACDTMEFTIPTAALASNIEISAWVNLVMNSRQAFWLDINWVEGSSSDDNTVAPEVTYDKMDVTATVPSNVAKYVVTIPKSAELGELSTTDDTTVSYEVEVDAGNVGKTITVTTEEEVTLTSDDKEVSLTITNAFGTAGVATFEANGKEEGTLTVKAADVADIATKDVAQNLSGSITFSITAE